MITVIGAGPAGCFYASKEHKDDVHIIEEHSKIGFPVSCTGILTDAVREIVKIPNKLIVGKINRFRIISPDGNEIYVDMKKPDLILDREKFDKYMATLAEDNGAKIHLKEEFIGLKKINNEYELTTSKRKYKTNMIVGADGPTSNVAKAAGIYGERKFAYGLQARCKYPKLEQGTTTIFLHYGEFGWIVPEDEKIARVGVIGCHMDSVRRDYNKIMLKAKILEHQSGIVPIYDPKLKIQKDNVYLLGDAAAQVKATTYGGIIYGMLAGKALAEDKQNYERNVRKDLGKDLWLSLKIREAINSMSERQENELVSIFSKKRNNEIISSFDRDFPSKFILKLMLTEPRLWKLGMGILFNRLIRS